MRDRLLLVPLLAPLALLAAGNDHFGFDSPGRLDSFIYVGNFWHYPEHLPVFEEDYKISRLTWIIPGYLAHRLGPTVGSYLLAYITLATGAAALYLIVRDATRDRTTATVAGVAWACCTWGHGIGGWSYHMLATTSWYLMGVWLMLRAALSNSPRWWAVAGGACVAAAIHAHLFVIVFTPLLLLVHVVALRTRGVQSLTHAGRDLLFAIGGGVLLTAVLGAINAANGGEWLFFMPQIRYTIWLAQPGNNQWVIDDPGRWVPAARYLVIPLLFMLVPIVLFARRSAARPALARALAIQAWGAFALLCFFQFVRHQTVLDHGYQAFILYVPAFLSAAVALAQPPTSAPPRSSAVIGAIGAALILGVLLFLMPALQQSLNQLVDADPVRRMGAVVPPLTLGLVGVIATALANGTARVLTFAAWFSIVNAWVAPDLGSYGLGSRGINRQMLTLFFDADRYTTALDPSLRGIKYWFSPEEVATPAGTVRLSRVFDSFVSTRGWLGNLVGVQSPAPLIAQLTAENLHEGPCFGVLTSVGAHESLVHEIEGHFAALNQPLTRVAARRFEQPLVSFALTVYRPANAPMRAGTARPPCLP